MKKRFLELLIIQAGFKPVGVFPYRTDTCDGQFEIGYGWKGEGVDEKGKVQISFEQPEGFNYAVAELMKEIYETENVKFNSAPDFKV